MLGEKGEKEEIVEGRGERGTGAGDVGEKDPQRLVAIAVTNAGEHNPPTRSGSITVVRVREGLTFLPDAKE